MEPQIYTIGKIKMVKQAYIVLVIGLIACGLLFLLSLFAFNNIKVKMVVGFISIVLFGLVCYEAYMINCTIVGNCNKLAWVLTVLFVFLSIANILNIYISFKMIDNMVSERKQFLSKKSSKSKK